MSALIMRIIDLEKTKTRPWRHIHTTSGFQDQKARTSRFQGQKTTTSRKGYNSLWFQGIFSEDESHDIEIPRLKNHDIMFPRPKNHDNEFLWNSDPYAP